MNKEGLIGIVGKVDMINWITVPGRGAIRLQPDITVYNLIPTIGRQVICSRQGSGSYNPASHIGVGTGTNPAAVGDIALQTPLGSRKSATFTAATGSPWINEWTTVFTATEINTATEMGLFNASTSGQLFSRLVFSAISIPIGSNMTVNYNMTYTF